MFSKIRSLHFGNLFPALIGLVLVLFLIVVFLNSKAAKNENIVSIEKTIKITQNNGNVVYGEIELIFEDIRYMLLNKYNLEIGDTSIEDVGYGKDTSYEMIKFNPALSAKPWGEMYDYEDVFKVYGYKVDSSFNGSGTSSESREFLKDDILCSVTLGNSPGVDPEQSYFVRIYCGKNIW